MIGESSQGKLKMIAHRLNNGPSPAQTLPEPDTFGLEPQMAELSRQRSAAIELADNHDFAVELDAGVPIDLVQQTNDLEGETISSNPLRKWEGGFF